MNLLKVVLALMVVAAHPAWANGADIVLLGDDARLSLIKQCGSSCTSRGSRIGTPTRNSTASDVASYSQYAKHAVVVVDATQGPLPVTREHIQIARQAGVPSLSIMFVNMVGLEGMKDAGELIELEELEVKEVMNAYEMKGDAAMVFHDARIRSIPKLHTNGVGLIEALELVASTPKRKFFDVEYRSGRQLNTYVYLLSPEESRLAVPLGKGSPVTLWVHGQVAKGAVASGKTLKPGDNGELALELTTVVKAAEGSRFLLEREGRIIALGVVVNLRS